MNSWNTLLLLSIGGAVFAVGCVPPSHQVLGEGEETRPVWSECEAAYESGQHMDACTFEDGSGCARGLTEPPVEDVSCISGDLFYGEFQVRAVPTESVEPCAEGVVLNEVSNMWADVLERTGPGCIQFGLCQSQLADPEHGLRATRDEWIVDACQRGSQTVVSTDMEPWVDCTDVIQEARDGEPCMGEFVCAGPREFSPGATSGPLFAWCDDGVLRMMDLSTVTHSPSSLAAPRG